MRKKNTFKEKDGYMVGVTFQGNEFYFDKTHLEKIEGHCWFTDDKGYVRAKINYKKVLLHRFLMLPPDTMVIDHINHNPMDNRKINLRICTRQQNQCNQKKQNKNTSSIFKGVFFDKDRDKWQSTIKVNSRSIFLGRFDTEEEASTEYDKAAHIHFGEYAHPNSLGYGGDHYR